MSRDDAFLLDMLLAAREAGLLLSGLSRQDFDRDRKTQLAAERVLQVIGEAANHVSQETRAAHPDIPWQAMIGLRNRLVHRYADIDLDIVWNTLLRSVPSLIAALNPVVSPEPPTSSPNPGP